MKKASDPDSYLLADLYSGITDEPVLYFFGTSFFALIGIYLLSISVIFPFYVYVYRRNRERDEAVSVFPITDHFYNVVLFIQLYAYFAVMAIIIPWFAPIELKAETSAFMFVVFIIIGYFLFVIVTLVLNFLLFFLALQRFLIYNFPKCDSYISPKKSTFKRLIIYVYIVVIVLQTSLLYHKFLCYYDSHRNITQAESCSVPYDDIYMYIYISSDVLVLISSVFYVIMLIEVRQFTKMAPGIRSNPEKYILYQTTLIMAMKIVLLLFVIFWNMGDREIDIVTIFIICTLIDIPTAQFVIQISYLLCNKNNVDTLLSIPLKKAKTWMVLCCGAQPSIAPNDAADVVTTSNQQRNYI